MSACEILVVCGFGFGCWEQVSIFYFSSSENI